MRACTNTQRGQVAATAGAKRRRQAERNQHEPARRPTRPETRCRTPVLRQSQGPFPAQRSLPDDVNLSVNLRRAPRKIDWTKSKCGFMRPSLWSVRRARRGCDGHPPPRSRRVPPLLGGDVWSARLGPAGMLGLRGDSLVLVRPQRRNN